MASRLTWTIIRSKIAVCACQHAAQTLMWGGALMLFLTLMEHGNCFSAKPNFYDTVVSIPWWAKRAHEANLLSELHSTASARRPVSCAEATKFVNQYTRHSVERRIAWNENWLQWSLSRFYTPLERTQNTELLIRGGLADCAERSQILKSIMEKSGAKCRFVGLDGHVVLEVFSEGQATVADPDYGVVYPLSIDELVRPENRELVRRKLECRGYDSEIIETYLAILYSVDNNRASEIGEPISPRLARIEQVCSLLVWGVPMFFVCVGMFLTKL